MNIGRNSSNKKLLIALSEEEITDFLPGKLFTSLKSMFPNHLLFLTNTASKGEFQSIIKQFKPEIILSAWSTPSMDPLVISESCAFLKYLCHITGTLRNIVQKESISSGLIVTNWGNSISNSVAECCLLLILSCLRRATFWTLSMHIEKEWKTSNYEPAHGLFGKRVGIHGFGFIARSLVTLLEPFHVSIKSFSPSVPDSIFRKMRVTRVHNLEELFRWSDILVELAPYTEKNYHIVTDKLLRMLRKDGIFINVGRGAVVDEIALAQIAIEGNLQIGLDVYENEPLPTDSPLRGLKNVALLPHVGGPTRDQRKNAGLLAIKNLERYIDNKALKFRVTEEIYDRIT